MERFFLKLLYGVLSIGLVLFVTGCGEDPRYSGNTQYVGGGVYGGEQGWWWSTARHRLVLGRRSRQR